LIAVFRGNKMRSTVTLFIAASLVALSGCSVTQVDYGPLQAQIAEAKAGDFGTCYTHIHSAAMALDEAEAGLASVKAVQGVYAGPMYDTAVAAVNSALGARAKADRACNARTAALEAQMPGVLAALDDHDNRLQDLESAYELMSGVTFHTGSAKLTAPSVAALDVIANLMLRSPVSAEVAGHASTPGAPAINKKLSSARAATVRNYLVKVGVNAKRLTSRGYGQSWPIADNNTAEGRRANQRVEIKFAQN
jgi:outer membrane protein OmpA-like peptidoglycan-associated protein